MWRQSLHMPYVQVRFCHWCLHSVVKTTNKVLSLSEGRCSASLDVQSDFFNNTAEVRWRSHVSGHVAIPALAL